MARLLVVDDDSQIRALLRRVAERCGYEVDEARDGIEALELLQKNTYPVALIDLMMPRFSGYELLESLREKQGRPRFIVVTAMADEYVARVAPDMAEAIVRKPFDVAMLTSVIRAVGAMMDGESNEADTQRTDHDGDGDGDGGGAASV